MTGIIEENELAATIGKEDQFALRRTGGPESYGNPYEPESLISLGEDPLGPYDHRHWPSLGIYREAVAGRIPPNEILKIAPRVKDNLFVSFGPTRSSLQEELRKEQEILSNFLIVPLEDLASGEYELVP